MAAFPEYVQILFEGFEEDVIPSVERIEMERGPAKEVRLNSRSTVRFSMGLLFVSKADVAAFDAWYFDEIKQIGWFTMPHPRTKQPIQARFIGGELGPLVPLKTQFRVARRDVVIEYYR